DALRPVDPDRRQVLPGRGRLLLVLRTLRRHAEGGRHLGLACRGRGHADPPRGGARGGGGRARGHRSAGQAPRPRRAGGYGGDGVKLFVKDKIAPYKYPRWIEFVTDLPKTATGKIQRFKLRA